ncbi:hypothetical protein CR532_00790 [Candidatus Borreliella tachyglossi]|uniref:Outer surface lipoprotein BB0158 domain-containing protein n=1 Tax=Candidatus Borreliella tachyglossi TaxID=1964448 RepID=A0A2S1LW74_9SPIR|nr:S2/P23 family protein [Candidatus Borreliella tachyglossi]AWG42549.1 hypothetical protein CR532_00790 [Candidatus Borreliella tachyglossi]
MLKKINLQFFIFILLIFLITGCAFFRKPQEVERDGNIGITSGNKIKLRFISGTTYKDNLPHIGSANMTWKKTKAMPILDEMGQAIPELKGMLGYAYVVSPIKMNGELSDKVSFLILFETTKKGDSEYIVEDLKLITAGKDLDLKDPNYLLAESSAEEGYKTSYPFGLLMSDEVRQAFDLTYIDEQWHYMLSTLSLRHKKTQRLKNYTISLNSKFVNDLLKEVLRLYPDIEELSFDLFSNLK